MARKRLGQPHQAGEYVCKPNWHTADLGGCCQLDNIQTCRTKGEKGRCCSWSKCQQTGITLRPVAVTLSCSASSATSTPLMPAPSLRPQRRMPGSFVLGLLQMHSHNLASSRFGGIKLVSWVVSRWCRPKLCMMWQSSSRCLCRCARRYLTMMCKTLTCRHVVQALGLGGSIRSGPRDQLVHDGAVLREAVELCHGC